MRFLMISFVLCIATFAYGDMGDYYKRRHLLGYADLNKCATFKRKVDGEKIELILKKGKIDKLTPHDNSAVNIPKFTETSQFKDFRQSLVQTLVWGAIFHKFLHILFGGVEGKANDPFLLRTIGTAYLTSRLIRFLSERSMFQDRNAVFLIEKAKYYENIIWGHIHTRPSDVNVLALGVHRSDFIDVVDFLLRRSFIMDYAPELL